MFHVVLYQPEIPPNTGNIIRLCANAGAVLHLVKPLGFPLDSAKMRRAGLDYHELSIMKVHENWQDCLADLGQRRLFALTTKGHQRYDKMAFSYQNEDAFVFGPETRGLPAEILDTFAAEHKLRLPMMAHNRSLNLANTVAIMLFEAWRQNDFLQGT